MTSTNNKKSATEPLAGDPDERISGPWPEIALIGAYPPPYGGVGVHLQRLVAHLEQAGVDFRLYNTVSQAERPPFVQSIARHRRLWTLWFCARNRCNIVHLVVTQWLAYLIFAVASFFRRGSYVISLHNMRLVDTMTSGCPIKKLLTRWLLRRYDIVVACNEHIAEACITLANVKPERVRVVPAFIPPIPQESPDVPADIRAFVDSADPVMLAATWLGREYEGASTYGTDMLVELIERIQGDYPQVGLIVTLLGGSPEEIEQVRNDASQRTGGHIFWVAEPLEDITWLLESSDLYLRPSNTDGDSIAVREALYFGIPVVASDAVARPDVCVLFKTRDMDEFEKMVRKSLANIISLRKTVASDSARNNAEQIVEIYKELKCRTSQKK